MQNLLKYSGDLMLRTSYMPVAMLECVNAVIEEVSDACENVTSSESIEGGA